MDFAFSFLSVQKENADLYFSYIDGEVSPEFVPDTIASQYTLKNQYFNNSIALGISYHKLNIMVKQIWNSLIAEMIQRKNGLKVIIFQKS